MTMTTTYIPSLDMGSRFSLHPVDHCVQCCLRIIRMMSIVVVIMVMVKSMSMVMVMMVKSMGMLVIVISNLEAA